MARIPVNIGDEIFVGGNLYEVIPTDAVGDFAGDHALRRVGLCTACNKNPGDDFQHEFGNLCGRCITTAMEGYALQCVLNHLMQHDETIVEVMHVMERADAHARTQTMPHVDFHSATLDAMWSWSDDDWQEIIMSWHASIRAVVDARTFIQST